MGNDPTLLLVDNCEHLVAAAASVVDELLGRSPVIRVVATSREPLLVDGELTLRVPSLGLPPPEAPVGELARFDAVRLFVDRAALALPGFALDDANAAAVTQICTRLDGIASAIELAAARVRTLPLEQIAAGLDDRFRLLAGGRRTALARQQTLLASVEWSHDLLDEPERIVLRRLACFVGGFVLAAAAEVAGFDPIRSVDVVDLVSRLVDRSLVHRDDDGRYRLLETIRAFALERLSDADESNTVVEEAVAYAQRSRGARSRPSFGWASLTPTEQRCVELVAEGLTNAQIGERLFIGRGTVKTHLARVFTKLGVTSRTELATLHAARGHAAPPDAELPPRDI